MFKKIKNKWENQDVNDPQTKTFRNRGNFMQFESQLQQRSCQWFKAD